MATFHFNLVSPEKIVFSAEVDQVDLPGAEGDFGVLAGHAPFISELRPGVVTVTVGGRQEKMIVLGGLAEVSPTELTVLADLASSMAEFDRAILEKRIADMEMAIAGAEKDTLLDRAITRLDHFKTLQMQIVGTAMH